jgi:HSP20 family protein
MRPRFPLTPLSAQAGEFAKEIEQAFLELGRPVGLESLAGECIPPVDVYERDDAVDIVLDLPGVNASTIRVVIKGDAVLIVGAKTDRRARRAASFHLVERDFGRFARVIRIQQTCDASRAHARLANGELHITLPKIAERRGRTIAVPIAT